ncbi:site-specific DNA-methyltransferase [Paracoccus lichenicola]|nr:site-specific DNA-methyltransferase [Paracoccus lichenicola]
MSKYDDLSREQLIALMEKRDRTKKLGLVWERDEIEADNAVDSNFVSATLVPELSDKAAPWRNMVIEGDNYDALRWLRMTMAGQIKCIYIDPPYNTGTKDWVYNDHYANPEDTYFHSTWLEFLFRRLTLARDLLAEDGVILVSINDDQRAKLELLMDEALPGMRIGSFVWKTRPGTKGEGAYLSQDHEHVLVYGKSAFRFGGSPVDVGKYSNDDNDPRGPWSSTTLQKNASFKDRPNSYFPVQDPQTEFWYPCNPNRVWSFQKRSMKSARGDTFEDLYESNQIIFTKRTEFQEFHSLSEMLQAIDEETAHRFLRRDIPDLDFWVGKKIGLGSVRRKLFLKDLKQDTKPVSSWANAEAVNPEANVIAAGMNQEGSKTVQSIFGSRAFDYAKPVSLIRELVRQSTGPGDTVLDFFAGSATTAQAVMELNAEDGGERRFIMVSSTEATTDNPGKNLCRDVTAERIRRLNASNDKKFAALSASFAYLRCREIEFEDLDYEFAPTEVWAALETLHRLPLTNYVEAPWQEHKTDEQTLIFADRVGTALLDHLRGVADRRENAFVYSWAPGQITAGIGEVLDVRSVRDELVGRFRQ